MVYAIILTYWICVYFIDANDFIIILKITNEGNSFKIEKTNNLAIL